MKLFVGPVFFEVFEHNLGQLIDKSVAVDRPDGQSSFL